MQAGGMAGQERKGDGGKQRGLEEAGEAHAALPQQGSEEEVERRGERRRAGYGMAQEAEQARQQEERGDGWAALCEPRTEGADGRMAGETAHGVMDGAADYEHLQIPVGPERTELQMVEKDGKGEAVYVLVDGKD